MPRHDDEIPDAMPAPTDQQLEPPQLRLGEPFAMSYEADLVGSQEGGGCTAILQCDCGQKFRIDLLAGGTKFCPGCRAGFTHCLLVAGADNTEIVAAAMEQVLVANGLKPPDAVEHQGDDDDDGEGDDDGDGDDGDGEGDDDDDDDDGEGDDDGDGDDAGGEHDG